ncbi:MAG: D-hexose-6-phosphate mutarotase [Acidobacteriaceae bacterium]
MTVEELNQSFGIPGAAEISAGNGGLPRLRIKTPIATGEIYLHGAHLTSWHPAGTDEVIFLSSRSQWQEGRAIRGGIPVCFPWFRNKVDDPKAPSHGFARTRTWQLDSVKLLNDAVAVSLSMGSDEGTRAWWPYDFHLAHRLSIGAELIQELVVSNTGSTALHFEEALHTYYRVGAADKVRISGLDGVAYLDNTDENRKKLQEGDIMFTAQTDRAYLDTMQAVEIEDPVLRRRIRLTKENSRTTVVWNPWATGAKTLSDLGDDGWRTMACVEASNMRDYSISLAPGQQHSMRTVIGIV